MKHRSTATDQTRDHEDPVGVIAAAPRQKLVVPAPRQKLIRRSLDTMKGCVVARRYHITGTIGSGGMGAVYEATDLQTGVEVALKALQPGAYDSVRLRRLRREAVTMTAIRSTHVCKVHYLGVERGTPFIVMERLHGETLRSRLSKHGSLPVAEAVAIACQLLDALTTTHEAGVIHRDVKPSNVFLTAGSSDAPHVKLIDFGLAKLKYEPHRAAVLEEDEITPTEVVAGTLHYLAPEQLLGSGDVDERVDVYAAGVTLFEMLTGERAYHGSYSEVIHDICLKDPPKLTALRPDLPSLFDDVIAMAMAKTRDRRFATAQAFKRALITAWESANAPTRSGICPAAYGPSIEDALEELTETGEDELPTLRPPPLVPDQAALLSFGVPCDDRREHGASDEHVDFPTVPPPQLSRYPRSR